MPSTLLPFLYSTRTILRSPRAPTAFTRSLHVTVRRCKKHNAIPFARTIGEPAVLPGESDVDVDADALPKDLKGGTITPSERRIFQSIFADIRTRGLKPTTIPEDPEAPSMASNRSALLIMQHAARDAARSSDDAVKAPAFQIGTAKDRNKALLRFPEELRAAASRVLDTIQPLDNNDDADFDSVAHDDQGAVEEKWESNTNSLGRVIELDAKRHPERMRVEGLIINAKTDFELWDVLEKEVFTMPDKLGIAQNPETTADGEEEEMIEKGSAKKKTKKKQKPTIPSNESQSIHGEEAEEAAVTHGANDAIVSQAAPDAVVEGDDASAPSTSKLSLYIHGPLYPAYLLLALRRLDTAFRAPSPLTFSLLPRIKELGLSSYILGVSTLFYNDLLEIYWKRRGDIGAMLDLLEEMRQCGLHFDKHTASVLNQAHNVTFDMADGISHSSFGRAIMTMPEYEMSVRARLRHWHRAVDISIAEQLESY
ncbi:hypothetical protein F4778DRAFT_752088 [Xylariomycetidae sp. FL2044]|nr:hypothetical protein F4778DRAFT_752088 [Xylariomycetidae sp. FL2044]